MKEYKIYVYGKEIIINQDENGNFIKPEIIIEMEKVGTAMKPSHEPICMARKPLAEKTVAENVLKYGTGGINIDDSRVDFISEEDKAENTGKNKHAEYKKSIVRNSAKNGIYHVDNRPPENYEPQGRFPANLIHDNSEEVLKEFEKAGISKSNNGRINKIGTPTDSPVSFGVANKEHEYSDSGTPARFFKQCEFTEEDFEYSPFFYCAKASKSERNNGCEELEENNVDYGERMGQNNSKIRPDGTERKPNIQRNNHPTVKPVALMEYLIKMVTPKGGIVLDPFAGSGTTLLASKMNGFRYIGIELTKEYIPIIEARLNSVKDFQQRLSQEVLF